MVILFAWLLFANETDICVSFQVATLMSRGGGMYKGGGGHGPPKF